MSYEFLTRVSLDVGYALIQNSYFMVTFSQSLRVCLLRYLSFFFFFPSHLLKSDWILPLHYWEHQYGEGAPQWQSKVLQNSSKKLLGIGESPPAKGCFGSPMQGSCLALLWSPLHQWGVFLKRSSYNKTQPNGGNMINSSIKLIGANRRYVEHLFLPCMQLHTTVELFMGPAPIGFIDGEVLPVGSVTTQDCCKCCSELQWWQNELFARAAWHVSCQWEIPQPWGKGVKWFPTALLFFSLLKAFKLFLALLRYRWLSPLLQWKQNGVLSSTSFKGGHSLQDLLYFLAKFVVFYLLGEVEGMHGVWGWRVAARRPLQHRGWQKWMALVALELRAMWKRT